MLTLQITSVCLIQSPHYTLSQKLLKLKPLIGEHMNTNDQQPEDDIPVVKINVSCIALLETFQQYYIGLILAKPPKQYGSKK